MRADPAAGRARNRRGDGTELRELRELVAGDSFRKIAWKASARRGKLMVREVELEERDVVWLVVDVSAEGWNGPIGDAPLDRVIDVSSAYAIERARKGAAVGVALVTDHVVGWSPPSSGGADLERRGAIWLDAADHYGADRCGMPVDELLRLGVEHARPLDPTGLADLPKGDVDQLLSRLEALRGRAPFALAPPRAASINEARDQLVRHYAASFGLDVPGRATGAMSLAGITDALKRIHRARPRATEVVILAPAGPKPDDELRDAVLRVRKRGARMRWALVDPMLGIEPPQGGELIGAAIAVELALARTRAIAALSAIGLRVVEAHTLCAHKPTHRYEDIAEDARRSPPVPPIESGPAR